MAINFDLIATRLSEARQLQSENPSDVSSNTGIVASRLSLIEKGTELPSGDELLILANYYKKDFRDFFDSSRPEPFKQTEILYRKHGDAFTKNDRRAIQEFLFLCEIEATLEKELNRRSNPFNFTPNGTHFKAHAEQAATALRRAKGYGRNEVPLDIYSDFRDIGFHIFRRRLENSDISGLYIQHPIAGHCILVNYEEDIYRQRFSVSHEAAHAIFDSSQTVSVSYQGNSSKFDKKDLQEIRANHFASCYLLPPKILSSIQYGDASQVKHWANTLKVSTVALSVALKKANIIDDETVEFIKKIRVPQSEKIDPELSNTLSSRQIERRKILLELGLSDYYVGLCFEAHQQGFISVGYLEEALLSNHADLQEISVLYGRKILYEL